MYILLLTVKWHVYLLVKIGGGGVCVCVGGGGGLMWGGVTNEPFYGQIEFSIKLH